MRHFRNGKHKTKRLFPKWFNAIAEIEVVNTFATLSFNPGNVLPALPMSILLKRKMLHPLIS